MKRTLIIGLTFSLLLAGCGGGGGAAPPAPIPLVPGPTKLTASYDEAGHSYTLSWTPPAGAFDGYNLEASVQQGAFTQLNQGLIPSNYTGAILTLTSAPPELVPVGFRICSVSHGVSSAYSNVAEVVRPLTPPISLTASYAPADGGIRVSWGTVSLVADRYVLERAPCDAASSPTGAWISLALPSPLQSGFLDTGVLESQAYLYRVTAWKGTVSSTTTGPSPRVAVPPKAPTSLAAQPQPTSVVLTWVNRSTTATQIQITRSPFAPNASPILATLPASATSYQDPDVPVGYYTYGVNVSDGVSLTTGPTILAAPANPPGAPTLVTTPLASAPSINTSDLSATGNWVYGTTFPWSVLPASWASWPAWSPGDVFAALPEFLSLDPQSHPHTAYRTQNTTSGALNHGWFDGVQWKTEVVQPLQLNSSYLSTALCLDRTGNPHILHDAGPGGSIAGLVYSYQAAGVWVHESIESTGAWNAFTGTPRLFLDRSDAPHVLVPTWFNTREYSRNADGTWSFQVLPNTLPSGGAYSFEDGVWSDAGTAWVFYQKLDPTDPNNDAFWVVQKVGGAWQQPVQLKSFEHVPMPAASVALSADGTRVAAVCFTYMGLKLFTQTNQGWTESLLPIPSMTFPYFKARFDGTGNLHVLVKPSAYTSEILDIHE